MLEVLPQHSLLVGEGAELFAEEQGFDRAELLTDDARRMFREALRDSGESVEGENTEAGPGDTAYRLAAIELVNRLSPHDGPWGTVNVIALDETGELVVGVSTSGYPWKYPGRVGDTALPGCGNYCDVRFGAAACTGRGELSMRISGARMVVDGLAKGLAPVDACGVMLREAAMLPDTYRSELRTLCLTPDGQHAGASGQRGSTYNVMTASSDQPEVIERKVF
jgi:beta-aspartyl-peptidase (threonine type)